MEMTLGDDITNDVITGTGTGTVRVTAPTLVLFKLGKRFLDGILTLPFGASHTRAFQFMWLGFDIQSVTMPEQ